MCPAIIILVTNLLRSSVIFRINIRPVSYTHLDVYKRQTTTTTTATTTTTTIGATAAATITLSNLKSKTTTTHLINVAELNLVGFV